MFPLRSVSVQYNNRGGRKGPREMVVVDLGVGGGGASIMLGTDPYSRIHCHTISSWKRTCMRAAREADLTL